MGINFYTYFCTKQIKRYMPTLFEIFGLRFFFFSNEHEPIHVHVENGDGRIKVQLTPTIEVVDGRGMKAKDIKKALTIIELYQEDIMDTWQKYFSK